MVMDFTPTFQLPMNQYDTATVIFQQLIDHYGLESSLAQRRYKPAKLIQALFDNMAAKHSFLRFFFTFIHEYSGQEADVGPDLGRPLSYFHDFLEWSPDRKRDLNEAIEAFATYIVDDFLLPLRASSAKTPQPTPSSLSSIQASTPTGTLGRVSGLRRTCLKRDQHRCVISNSFDLKEADKRYEQEGDNYRDDAGNFLRDEPSENFAFLEVAHILPHCLTTVSTGDADLSDSKKIVLQILDMFDPGIIHLIDGPAMDSPRNALTLTNHYHQLFGQFQIHFEATGRRDEYKIDLTRRRPHLRQGNFPIIRKLSESPDGTIDLPSPRLLAVHRSIACIMHLSGAGEYINGILRDLEEVNVKADGSTNLEFLMNLSLGGWLNTMTVY